MTIKDVVKLSSCSRYLRNLFIDFYKSRLFSDYPFIQQITHDDNYLFLYNVCHANKFPRNTFINHIHSKILKLINFNEKPQGKIILLPLFYDSKISTEVYLSDIVDHEFLIDNRFKMTWNCNYPMTYRMVNKGEFLNFATARETLKNDLFENKAFFILKNKFNKLMEEEFGISKFSNEFLIKINDYLSLFFQEDRCSLIEYKQHFNKEFVDFAKKVLDFIGCEHTYFNFLTRFKFSNYENKLFFIILQLN